MNDLDTDLPWPRDGAAGLALGESEGAALDLGGSRELPGSAREHALPVELQGERTPADPGRSAPALPRGGHLSLARTAVRWCPPLDDLRLGRGGNVSAAVRWTWSFGEFPFVTGENSEGAPVNPVEPMLADLARVGRKQSEDAWLPEACR